MDAKHTPGPWADDSTLQPSARPVIARTAGGTPISGNWSGPISTEQDAANAALIGAAPELLEALAFYVQICGNTCAFVDRQTAREMWEKGRAAIAKATGAA